MYGHGLSRVNLTSGNLSCSKTNGLYMGAYCGALIINDGWKISDGYPW